MNKGWMRVREAAHLMSVSDTTIRRRVESGTLRGREGKSGRQEVFLPAQLRRELESKCATPISPGHLERGKGQNTEADALATPVTTASVRRRRSGGRSRRTPHAGSGRARRPRDT